MGNQIVVRQAKLSDKTEFMRLWETCFHDSQSFMDWMFGERFYPEHAVCLLEGVEMCSTMQAIPYDIVVRGKSIKGVMLCGVATDPKHQRRGFMGQIFRKEMQMLREQGFVLAVHTPAVLQSYFGYGHYPVANALYVTGSAPSDEIQEYVFLQKPEIKNLYPLYQMEMYQYSGSILRSEAEFIRKYDDYAADGGKCIVITEGNQILGYAMFYETETEVISVENIAIAGAYPKLILALLDIAKGRKILVKLPPAAVQQTELPEGLVLEEKQKGVAGICNIQKLLEQLKLDCPYTVEVYGDVIIENNGVFDFTGKKSKQPPVLKIEAGKFLGVLMGYVTLDEILADCTVYKLENVTKISKILPKDKCYIIDEY
ncbi:GNAT family N-acetyltransferase [Chakrabartyella piscis]|uniref:GNAT family N-acetyltransferase n=1 Tax=Chakrabartyella piscis TaxID=2918914 RepID=UPI002958C429|nr:GNAT family N-acetyltransferase [Chakrabartyella piscis]